MRTILINPKITALAATYAQELFVTRRHDFDKPATLLPALQAGIPANVPNDYRDYVAMVIRIYRLLNAVQPKDYGRLHQKFFARFHPLVNLSLKMTYKGAKKEFYKHVSDAMRYDGVRKKEFLPYAKKLGISTCVYCNANYALTIQLKKEKIGKFELDHFQPQSLCPYLSTNFYNLYPVCGNCNKYKSNTLPEFYLYNEDYALELDFAFTLDKKSVIKYMLSQNAEDLKITFRSLQHPEHNKTFKIDSTYSALKDVVEELVWKHKVYNPLYLKTLSKAFEKKFSHTSLHRFILGNYDQPGDIHKRPLTKLTQDIARQLGILKF